MKVLTILGIAIFIVCIALPVAILCLLFFLYEILEVCALLKRILKNEEEKR